MIFGIIRKLWVLLLMVVGVVSCDNPEGHRSIDVSQFDGLTAEQIDVLATEVMTKFDIPGMSIGIIKDGEIVHLRGYGLRSIGAEDAITPETLFSIASATKAFTATSLAILVDQGRLKWDDKVTEYIPEFQLYDPWASHEFTVRDLLIHNSGLARGQGDLMFWPETDFSRAEIIDRLKYLKPVSGFREKYAYTNMMYIVAGEVVLAASGQSLEDFTDAHILKPLGMEHCAANRSRLEGQTNIATPHVVVDGALVTVRRMKPITQELVIAGPGGIECSAESLLKWLDMNLQNGQYDNEKTLISREQHAQIISAHSVRKVGGNGKKWFHTQFKNYGLGWSVFDAHGYKWVTHAGALQGTMSYVGFIPEQNVGVVVLINQESGAGLRAVFFALMQSYVSNERADWVERYFALETEGNERAVDRSDELLAAAYVPPMGLESYTGIYRDIWFGDVEISRSSKGLRFTADRSPRLIGTLIPAKENLFVIIWDDRSLKADAYIRFHEKQSRFTMKAVSSATDASFDFGNLDFKRAP